MTPEEKKTVAVYDELAAEWTSKHSQPGFWSDMMEKFHEHLPEGRVLEIGSGGGRDARELADMGYSYVGTDISEGLLEVARRNCPDLDFRHSSVYDLEFDEPFDGFWAVASLLHVPKDRIGEALRKIRGLVKDGAVGLIVMKPGNSEKVEETYCGKRFYARYIPKEFAIRLVFADFDVLYQDTVWRHEQAWTCTLVKAVSR